MDKIAKFNGIEISVIPNLLSYKGNKATENYLKRQTELWLLNTWYHSPFEDEFDQLLVKQEMISKGFKFNNNDITHVPSIIQGMLNTLGDNGKNV